MHILLETLQTLLFVDSYRECLSPDLDLPDLSTGLSGIFFFTFVSGPVYAPQSKMSLDTLSLKLVVKITD